MDISLISYKENLYSISAVGDHIAEYYHDISNRNLYHIQLYDPDKNLVREILPNQRKSDVVEIINCIWNSKDIYFASYVQLDEEHIEFSIIKYVISTDTQTTICTFIDNRAVLERSKRVKVFILTESTILLQGEIQHTEASENMLGNIEFSLSLYNVETYKETSVTETNFLNNGIDTIIPISDNKILIKTGYSYLEDDRLNPTYKDEAFIESVQITTAAKFIADITLATDSVDMELIESSYLDSHIIRPRVTGDYIHFCVMNIEKNTTKCVFYNHITAERFEYNIKGIDFSDIYITYVIDNIPYVRKKSDDNVNFVNLEKAEIDITFYDAVFEEQLGDIFILSSFNGKYMSIYSYPKLNFLLQEKKIYFLSCKLKDAYYIYY